MEKNDPTMAIHQARLWNCSAIPRPLQELVLSSSLSSIPFFVANIFIDGPSSARCTTCSSFGESASTTATTNDDRIIHHGEFPSYTLQDKTMAKESQRKGMVKWWSSSQVLRSSLCEESCFGKFRISFCMLTSVRHVSGTAEQKLVRRAVFLRGPTRQKHWRQKRHVVDWIVMKTL